MRLLELSVIPVVIFALVIGIIFLVKTYGGKQVVSTDDLPYHKKDYLLTKAELSFYRVLKNVVDDLLKDEIRQCEFVNWLNKVVLSRSA